MVLAKLFSDLLGRKDKGQLADEIETINQVLENELGLDIRNLVDIPSGNLIDELKTQKGLTNESLEDKPMIRQNYFNGRKIEEQLFF